MCLGFSKLLGKLVVKYVSTYTKGTLKTRSAKDIILCLFDVFVRVILIFFIKTYVVGTHLNCIDKSMQFKWVPTTYVTIKKWTKIKYTGCILKIMDLLDCAFIGVCAVIRSNMVTVLARILFI